MQQQNTPQQDTHPQGYNAFSIFAIMLWGIAFLILITAFPGHLSFIPPAENPVEKIGFALTWIVLGLVMKEVGTIIQRSEARTHQKTQPQNTPQ